ncbi:MAG: Uma2 family endonuclease [Spirochaetota bacterium]
MKNMGIPLKKNDRLYTYADYLTWPDEERWELIEGVAYDMSPAPNRRHQHILGQLFRKIADFLDDKPCQAYFAPFDLRLSEKGPIAKDAEITNVVQPDLSVYCREHALDERGARGAPDLIAEILSPHTSLKDQREKLLLYERFQVKEYWIIDPERSFLWAYRLQDRDLYGKPEVFGPEDTVKSTALQGFSVNLGTLFTELEEKKPPG